MNSRNQFVNEDYFFFESFVNNKNGKGRVHYHDSFEIYYLLEGTCWYFIDKKSYHITAGDIALIPPGVIHKTSYETDCNKRLLINCSMSYIPPSVTDLILKSPCFSGSDSDSTQIRQIFDSIHKEFFAPDEFSRDILKYKVYELLLLIEREKKTSVQSPIESRIVEKSVSYIRSHYTEKVTLQSTAKYCFVSKEHLSRTFKKETGFGFNEYLTVYRLKKADRILRGGTKIKISDVALSCGFNDSNYFSKIYKKIYKISPTEARKAGNENKPK